MRIEDYEYEIARKFPMGPDIFEECKIVDDMPEADPDVWKPLFHPTNFAQQHGQLKFEDFKLSDQDMDRWTNTCKDIE